MSRNAEMISPLFLYICFFESVASDFILILSCISDPSAELRPDHQQPAKGGTS